MPEYALGLTLLVAAMIPCAPAQAPQGEVKFGPWSAIGPFGRLPEERDVMTAFWPEKSIVSAPGKARSPDLDATGPGLEKRTVQWSLLPTGADDAASLDVGTINVRRMVPPPTGLVGWTQRAAVYLHRTITTAEESRLPVFVGAESGLRMWLNGELGLEHVEDEYGTFLPYDRGVVLNLGKGENHLFVKLVSDDDGELQLSLRAITRPEREAVSKAISSAAAFLISKQLPDGSWSGEEHDPYARTALVLRALAAAGLPADHPAIRAGCASLGKVEVLHLNGTPNIVELLARHRDLRAHCPVGTYEHALATLGRGFDRGDLVPRYHVGYAAGHVRAMATAHELAGWPLSADLLEAVHGSRRQFGWVRPKEQKRKGQPVPAGFGSQAGFAIDAYSTVAGMTVLEFLGRYGGRALSAKDHAQLALERDQCLAWLNANARWDEVVGSKHPYQYVFAQLLLLQQTYRALAISDLGGIDLRAATERLLLESQRSDGAWSYYFGESELSDTPRAILLLAAGLEVAPAEAPKDGK